MKNKVCFVIPTYPPRYEFALQQRKSFYDVKLNEEADLIYIFSSTEERDAFPECTSVILPKSLRRTKNNGMINIKKYYAILRLKHDYEYIITLDDDSLFLKKINIYTICEKYYNEKILIGNLLLGSDMSLEKLTIAINNRARSYFVKNRKEMFENDSTICLWFNQLCIYNTSLLDEFFKITKIDKNLHYLTWYDFDYNIFMQYLLFNHDFVINICGIEADISISELTSIDEFNIKNNDYQEFEFFALSSHMQKILPNRNTFITLHTDRDVKKPSTKSIIKECFCSIRCYCEYKNLLRMRR